MTFQFEIICAACQNIARASTLNNLLFVEQKRKQIEIENMFENLKFFLQTYMLEYVDDGVVFFVVHNGNYVDYY